MDDEESITDDDITTGSPNRMMRADIKGEDEDLTPLEEFYLSELEQSIHCDLIEKMKHAESNLKNKITEEKNNINMNRRKSRKELSISKLKQLKSELALHRKESYKLAFSKISEKNKHEVNSILGNDESSEEERFKIQEMMSPL